MNPHLRRVLVGLGLWAGPALLFWLGSHMSKGKPAPHALFWIGAVLVLVCLLFSIGGFPLDQLPSTPYKSQTAGCLCIGLLLIPGFGWLVLCYLLGRRYEDWTDGWRG